MALRRLLAATVPAVLAVATAGSARAPAPLVPIALVEDVKSATAEVEFMDYVGRGQVIKLGPGDTLVLSYLKSCEHETITGGTVLVGMERSEVKDGQVARAKVPCNGGRMQLRPQQASTSAAPPPSDFRVRTVNRRSLRAPQWSNSRGGSKGRTVLCGSSGPITGASAMRSGSTTRLTSLTSTIWPRQTFV